MLSLMLDLKLKNLCLIFFFSGHEEGVVLAKVFHRKFCILWF
jgi:hypothetical protein